MKILACDTSTKVLSVAVAEDNKVIKSYHCDESGESDYLFVVIEKFLKSLKIKFSSFDLFAVGIGPGSFTGLRIGTCAFKTFAFVANKPLVGINSFEAIAWNFEGTDKMIYVCEDAKKDKVYAAGYYFDKKGNLKVEQKCALFDIETLLKKINPAPSCGVLDPAGRISSYHSSPQQAVGYSGRCGIKKPVIVAGGGIKKYREEILSLLDKNSLADEKFWHPRADIVARLALEKFRGGRTNDPQELVPLYLHSERANITKPRKL